VRAGWGVVLLRRMPFRLVEGVVVVVAGCGVTARLFFLQYFYLMDVGMEDSRLVNILGLQRTTQLGAHVMADVYSSSAGAAGAWDMDLQR